MAKRLGGLLLAGCIFAGCFAPQPSGSRGRSTVDSASAGSEEDDDTIFVPPPVGSLLGGGSVRVARNYSGNDERAREGELQAQQDVLRLRFGDLCAINAIARGDSRKVQEILRA